MFNFGGTFTGDYGKSKTDYDRQTDYWTPEQKKTSKSLFSGVVKPGFENYGDIYTGQPTNIEQTALKNLQAYGGQTPGYAGDASAALQRALTGQGYSNIIDPTATENLYSSIQERTLKDILPQAVTAAAGEANVGGMLHSGTGQKLVTDQIGQIVRALSEQLSTLKYSDEQQRRDIAREREGRQLSAIPQTQTLTSEMLSRILPCLQYGGAERDIAGTQFQNPLTQLALQFLGLRGQENTTGSSDTTKWNLGTQQYGGFGMK